MTITKKNRLNMLVEYLNREKDVYKGYNIQQIKIDNNICAESSIDSIKGEIDKKGQSFEISNNECRAQRLTVEDCPMERGEKWFLNNPYYSRAIDEIYAQGNKWVVIYEGMTKRKTSGILEPSNNKSRGYSKAARTRGLILKTA